MADDDTEKYIAKFTWKYADNRLTLEKPYEGDAKVLTQQFEDKSALPYKKPNPIA